MFSSAKYGIYLKLHFIIFLWGFTGILGTVISLDSYAIVVHRMAIAFLSIITLVKLQKGSLKIDRKRVLPILGTGLLIAVHWITFFEALKVSNVSVTLACLASTSLFTAIIEPIFFKKRLVWYEIFFGFVVIAGLGIIFQFETSYTLGIILSITSAFFAALFTVINAKFVKHENAKNITLYEMLAGCVGILIYLAITGKMDSVLTMPQGWDWLYIPILGLICTAYAFAVSVDIMKVLSPFTVAITVNLEPIYAIIMALLFFGEKEYMSTEFYVGALVILLTIFGNTWLKSREKKKLAA